jgi:hypothetical protein
MSHCPNLLVSLQHIIRITKVGNGFAAAEVFNQNIKKDTMQEMGANETQ